MLTIGNGKKLQQRNIFRKTDINFLSLKFHPIWHLMTENEPNCYTDRMDGLSNRKQKFNKKHF